MFSSRESLSLRQAVYGVDRSVWQSSGDAKAPSLLEQRLAGKLQAAFPLSARATPGESAM